MKNEQKSPVSFKEMTNQFSLQKTLRFELRYADLFPETKNLLETGGIFERDKVRAEKYKLTKPWIDRFHREFIIDALKDFKFSDLESYRKILKAHLTDKKSKDIQKKLEKIEGGLRSEIRDSFDNAAARLQVENTDHIKKSNTDALFEASIFKVLENKYKDEDGVIIDGANIFDGWNNWAGYFDKFFQTRKNFYSTGEESTAIAFRIINQNLRRFIQNIEKYESIKEKVVDLLKAEKNLDVNFDEVFSLHNYNTCLLQDGIDAYNRAIGGFVDEKTDAKIPGINQLVNEYRQKTKEKLGFLTMLDKQIHSEKDAFMEAIEDDEELLGYINNFTKGADYKFSAMRKLFLNIAQDQSQYNLEKIYISSNEFVRSGTRWFFDFETIQNKLLETGKSKAWKDIYKTRGLGGFKFDKDKSEIKYPSHIISKHLAGVLGDLSGNTDLLNKRYSIAEEKPKRLRGIDFSLQGIAGFFYAFLFEIEKQFERVQVIDGASENATELIGYDVFRPEIDHVTTQNISQNKSVIKNYFDSSLHIYQIIKYFAPEKKRQWLEALELDDNFYNDANTGLKSVFYDENAMSKSAYDLIVREYNLVRNYLTQKPYSTDKWLLKFDTQTLAKGWDRNKEKDNASIILRKDGRYYLGIMHPNSKDLFLPKNQKEYAGIGFEKMAYAQMASPSKDIQNFLVIDGKTVRKTGRKDRDGVNRQLERIKDEFLPQKINNIRKQKTYLKSNENFSVQDANMFIDYYKDRLIDYYKGRFEFLFRDIYSDFKEFSDHVGEQTYWIKFEDVSETFLAEKSRKGEIYIFEIQNKDWNLKDGQPKEGAKNLQTVYWEGLFDDVNKQKNFVLKLGGLAELFFRPKTPKEKWRYKVRDKITNKYIFSILNETTGKIEPIKENYPGAIVDKKRFTEDKMFFHCPITLNRTAPTAYSKDDGMSSVLPDLNQAVQNVIREQKQPMRIIGIDRGEKHLAYISVIDEDGKILLSKTLNGNYAEVLAERAKDRIRSRQDWSDVEQIKDTKKGFVSHMVHEVVSMALEYNAVIALEKLNFGFKQKRSAIEKSIYQQFEKQLLQKLSLVVDKKILYADDVGGVLNALQLASPISAMRDIGHQDGIVFFVPAEYTSSTDPVTGWRKHIYLNSGEKLKEHFENRDIVLYYNEEQCSHIFKYDQKTFDTNLSTYPWEMRVYTPRIVRFKSEQGYWDTKKMDKDLLDYLFNAWNFTDEEKKSSDISRIISTKLSNGELDEKKDWRNGPKKRKESFFDGLLYILNQVQNMRNSTSESSKNKTNRNAADYIASPVVGGLITYADTYTNEEFTREKLLSLYKGDNKEEFVNEFNADALGAYNIARKGLMMLERIKNNSEKPDLFIKRQDWDKWAQENRAQ